MKHGEHGEHKKKKKKWKKTKIHFVIESTFVCAVSSTFILTLKAKPVKREKQCYREFVSLFYFFSFPPSTIWWVKQFSGNVFTVATDVMAALAFAFAERHRDNLMCLSHERQVFFSLSLLNSSTSVLTSRGRGCCKSVQCCVTRLLTLLEEREGDDGESERECSHRVCRRGKGGWSRESERYLYVWLTCRIYGQSSVVSKRVIKHKRLPCLNVAACICLRLNDLSEFN